MNTMYLKIKILEISVPNNLEIRVEKSHHGKRNDTKKQDKLGK